VVEDADLALAEVTLSRADDLLRGVGHRAKDVATERRTSSARLEHQRRLCDAVDAAEPTLPLPVSAELNGEVDPSCPSGCTCEPCVEFDRRAALAA
jgi:hypothetical protein